MYLSRFDFVLKYVASKSIRKVDNLSRRADWAKEVERDNENQIILKKKWLEIRAMEKMQLLIEEAEEEILEKIKKSEAKNDEIVKVVEEIKKIRVKVLRNDELVLKEGKVYVLKDKSLRLEIIQLHHNIPIAGHKGQ